MADKPVTRLASEMAGQKKKRGFFDKVGGFLADAGQEVGRMVTNPVETVQRLGSEAKSTFYDPIANLPSAFDPTSGLSPLERVNTGLSGGLALADAFTPFMPEGALANAMVRNATNKAIAETAAARTTGPRFNNMMLSNGQMLPRSASTVQYAEALRRMQNELKLVPDQAVASIQMQGSQFPGVLKAGEYNPAMAGDSGYLGARAKITEQAGVFNEYAAHRAAIEQDVGGGTYGMLREPMDFRSGAGYRQPRSGGTMMDAAGNPIEEVYDLDKLKAWQIDQGNQVILDVRPGPGATVTPGDSYNIYNRMRAAGYDGSFSDFVLQYDKSLPAINQPVPGYPPVVPDIYENMLTGANLRSRNPSMNEIPKYAEVQMPPVPLSEIDRAWIMRDANFVSPTYKPPTPSGWMGINESIPSPTPMRVMAQNRAMAKAARAKGITPVTGVLDQAISKFGDEVVERARASMSPQDFFNFITTSTTFTPDKVPIDQIPGPEFWADMRKMAEKVIADRKKQTAPVIKGLSENERRRIGLDNMRREIGTGDGVS